MKRTARSRIVAVMIVGTVLPIAQMKAQSSGGPYRIKSSVIAGGGGTLSGGAFELGGTLGQTATATLAASGYRIYDGFWAPATNAPSDEIFVNGFDQ